MNNNVTSLKNKFLRACGPLVLAALPMVAQADEPQQSLSLLNLHTKESLNVTYKRNGQYVPEALARISHLLRDHRKNEETAISPQTLDRLHAIGEVVRIKYPHIPIKFEIISGYRTPGTNQALKSNGGSQATKSRHMIGDAIDMRVPGVSTKALRDIAWCTGSGGTGYYAHDGFVHIDSGNKRFWPEGWNPHDIRCN